MDYNYLKTLPKDILIKLIVELETSFSTVYILNRCFVNSRNMEEGKEMMGVYLSFEKAIEAVELYTIDQDDTVNHSLVAAFYLVTEFGVLVINIQ